jgi:hypothetical protein
VFDNFSGAVTVNSITPEETGEPVKKKKKKAKQDSNE